MKRHKKRWRSSQTAIQHVILMNSGNAVSARPPDDATFTGGIILCKIYSLMLRLVFLVPTQRTWVIISRLCVKALESRKEKTMRRQAHVYTWTVVPRLVLSLKFPVSDAQDRSATLQFPQRYDCIAIRLVGSQVIIGVLHQITVQRYEIYSKKVRFRI